MPGGSDVARVADLVAGGEQRHPQPAKDGQLAIAEGGGKTEIRRREPPPGEKRYRALGDVLSGVTPVRSLPDSRLQPHPLVFDDAVLLHHDRVGAFGHRGAGEDPDSRALLGGMSERVTRRGPAGNRKHGFLSRHQIGMGEGIAVDRAIGVRRQVHRGNEIASENAAAGAAQAASSPFRLPL